MVSNATSHEGGGFAKLVFSYRRAGSTPTVGRLQDRLEEVYTANGVYRDIDDIPLARDFREELRREIENANALLVVIGPQWLTVQDENGRRRLDDQNDVVRIEIEAAIDHGVDIVPLYVNGGAPPTTDELPRSLHPLVFAQGQRIRDDPDFRADVGTLLRRLAVLVPPPIGQMAQAVDPEEIDQDSQSSTPDRADSETQRLSPDASIPGVRKHGTTLSSIAPYIAGITVVVIILAIIVIVTTS